MTGYLEGGFKVCVSGLKITKFVRVLSCLICIGAGLFLASCDINSDPVSQSEKTPIATVKPDDLSHLFPSKGRERVELVERNLLGKDYLPGGNLVEYTKKGVRFQQFLIKTSTPEKAMFLMIDLKNDLENAKFIPHLGGYFGSDGGGSVLVMQRGRSLAGVVGLPEIDADNVLREFAQRLD